MKKLVFFYCVKHLAIDLSLTDKKNPYLAVAMTTGTSLSCGGWSQEIHILGLDSVSFQSESLTAQCTQLLLKEEHLKLIY